MIFCGHNHIICERIHANPRETKSGRGGYFFSSSEGRKMLHSAAFWIQNLCSQNFKYSMIKP